MNDNIQISSKRSVAEILLIVLLGLSFALLLGFSTSNVYAQYVIDAGGLGVGGGVGSFTINTSKTTIAVGESISASPSVSAAIKSFISSNTAVVRVSGTDRGTITGVGPGTATVTMTARNGVKATKQITVSGYGNQGSTGGTDSGTTGGSPEEPATPPSPTLSIIGNQKVGINQTLVITIKNANTGTPKWIVGGNNGYAIIAGKTTTELNVIGRKVSGNERIVITGFLNNKKLGVVYVTVTSDQVVQPTATDPNIPENVHAHITANPSVHLALGQYNKDLLNANVYDTTNKTLHFTSSNQNIVTVGYTSGLLTAISEGTATITISHADTSSKGAPSIQVTVIVGNNDNEQNLGKKLGDIVVRVGKQRTIESGKWTSRNTNCVTVSDSTTIKGVDVGTTRVVRKSDNAYYDVQCVKIERKTNFVELQEGSSIELSQILSGYSGSELTVTPKYEGYLNIAGGSIIASEIKEIDSATGKEKNVVSIPCTVYFAGSLDTNLGFTVKVYKNAPENIGNSYTLIGTQKITLPYNGEYKWRASSSDIVSLTGSVKQKVAQGKNKDGEVTIEGLSKDGNVISTYKITTISAKVNTSFTKNPGQIISFNEIVESTNNSVVMEHTTITTKDTKQLSVSGRSVVVLDKAIVNSGKNYSIVANFIVSIGGKNYTCKVTIQQPPLITDKSITLNGNEKFDLYSVLGINDEEVKKTIKFSKPTGKNIVELNGSMISGLQVGESQITATRTFKAGSSNKTEKAVITITVQSVEIPEIAKNTFYVFKGSNKEIALPDNGEKKWEKPSGVTISEGAAKINATGTYTIKGFDAIGRQVSEYTLVSYTSDIVNRLEGEVGTSFASSSIVSALGDGNIPASEKSRFTFVVSPDNKNDYKNQLSVSGQSVAIREDAYIQHGNNSVVARFDVLYDGKSIKTVSVTVKRKAEDMEIDPTSWKIASLPTMYVADDGIEVSDYPEFANWVNQIDDVTSYITFSPESNKPDIGYRYENIKVSIQSGGNAISLNGYTITPKAEGTAKIKITSGKYPKLKALTTTITVTAIRTPSNVEYNSSVSGYEEETISIGDVIKGDSSEWIFSKTSDAKYAKRKSGNKEILLVSAKEDGSATFAWLKNTRTKEELGPINVMILPLENNTNPDSTNISTQASGYVGDTIDISAYVGDKTGYKFKANSSNSDYVKILNDSQIKLKNKADENGANLKISTPDKKDITVIVKIYSMSNRVKSATGKVGGSVNISEFIEGDATGFSFVEGSSKNGYIASITSNEIVLANKTATGKGASISIESPHGEIIPTRVKITK